jgi:hypothetical protein
MAVALVAVAQAAYLAAPVNSWEDVEAELSKDPNIHPFYNLIQPFTQADYKLRSALDTLDRILSQQEQANG